MEDPQRVRLGDRFAGLEDVATATGIGSGPRSLSAPRSSPSRSSMTM